MDDEIDQNIVSAFNKSVGYLKSKGAIVETISINYKLLKAIYPTYIIISSAEATSNYANLDGIRFGNRAEGKTYEEIVMNTRTKYISEYAKKRLVIGSFSLLKENQEELFLKAQKCRRLIVDAFNKVFEKYDFIYCPASPTTAPLIDLSKNKIADEYLASDNYLAFGNMGGFPSITLPIGLEENMPFGANLSAKPFCEAELFNVAAVIEEGTGLKNLVIK